MNLQDIPCRKERQLASLSFFSLRRLSLCFAIAIGCLTAFPNSSYSQTNIDRFFEIFDEGDRTEKMNALRAASSLVLKQVTNEAEREKIISFLKDHLAEDDPAVRLTIHIELLKMAFAEDSAELGKIAMQATNDSHVRVRRGIMKHFRTFFATRKESAKNYEPVVLEKLRDDDLDVRFHAAFSLFSWGIANDEIVGVLLDGMQLTNYRSAITYALVKDQQNRNKTVKVIADRLRKSDHYAGVYIGLLSTMTPESNAMLPEILDQFESPQPSVRSAVLTAMTKMDNLEKERCTKIIKKAVRDPEAAVRKQVISALLPLGPSAETLKEIVIQLIADSDSKVSELAATALTQFAGRFDVIAPELRQKLAGDDRKQIYNILSGLILSGPLANEISDDVAKLLNYPDLETRVRACWALGEISLDRDATIAKINDALAAESDPAAVFAFVQTLSRLAPNDDRSKEQFLKNLDTDNRPLKLACIQGLKPYSNDELAQALLTVDRPVNTRLGDNLDLIDNAVVDTMVAMGEPAAEVARKHLDSENSIIRGRALRVLGASPGGADRDVVLTAMRSDDRTINYAGAIAASQMSTVDEEILETMFGLADANLRQRTVNILDLFGQMGANAGLITPRIASLLNGEFRNRYASDAKSVLVKLGPHAAPAVNELMKGQLNIYKLDCLIAIGGGGEALAEKILNYISTLEKKVSNNRSAAINDANVRSQLFAAVALNHINGDQKIANRLIMELLAGDEKQRRIALGFIAKLKHPSEQMLKLLEDRLPNKQALKTLADLGTAAKSALPKLKQLTQPENQTDNQTVDVGLLYTLYKITGEVKYAIGVVDQILHDNRFELVDIKVEQRQTLWETLRNLHNHHSADSVAVAKLDAVSQSRFSNLRAFVNDLRNVD